MNYYSFHIGDYTTRTAHLSWEEDMAYRRLIDLYYGTEKPLPADRAAIYRLARAATDDHRRAIDTVLDEFFTLTDAGWENERCAEEIAAAADKRGKAAKSARMRWAEKPHSKGNANAMPTQCEGNAPNTQYPIPNSKVRLWREPAADLEARLREAAGWQSHPSPNLFVIGPIQALIDEGADLEMDVLPVIKANSHRCRSPAWVYFIPIIRDALAKRLEASKPLTQEEIDRARKAKLANSSKPSRSDSFAEVNRLIDEAERRENAAGGNGGGPPAVGEAGSGPGAAGIRGNDHRSDSLARGRRDCGPGPPGDRVDNGFEVGTDAGGHPRISETPPQTQGMASRLGKPHET